MSTENTKAIYRPKDAMCYLSCGRSYFYRLIQDGYLEFGYKRGKFRFWKKEQLDQAIRKMMKESEKGE